MKDIKSYSYSPRVHRLQLLLINVTSFDFVFIPCLCHAQVLTGKLNLNLFFQINSWCDWDKQVKTDNIKLLSIEAHYKSYIIRGSISGAFNFHQNSIQMFTWKTSPTGLWAYAIHLKQDKSASISFIKVLKIFAPTIINGSKTQTKLSI